MFSFPQRSRRTAAHAAAHLQRGFTLIELMVVLVIIGILGVFIVPTLMDRPDQARVDKAKAEMEKKGAKVLGEPRLGAHGTMVIFIHPKDSDGVLIELMETPRVPH